MDQENKKFDLSNRLFVVVSIVVLIGFCAFLVETIFKIWPPDYPREFVVSGEGKVFVKPDVATIKIGVKSEGVNAKLVFEENTKKINAILDEIKTLGIEEKDIQTTRYNLTPEYEFPDGRKVFKGYVLEQEIKVKIRNLEKVGEVIEKASQKGANLISEISFVVEEPEISLEKAREEAIKKAKEKAEKISQTTGIRLKKILNIYEGSAPPFAIYPIYKSASGEMDLSTITPQIQPGEQELTVRVTLIYQIK
jgi:uncharacterized protein YggE